MTNKYLRAYCFIVIKMNNLTAVSSLLSSFQQSIAAIHHDVKDLKEKYKVMQKELDDLETMDTNEDIVPSEPVPFELTKEHYDKIEKLVEEKVAQLLQSQLLQNDSYIENKVNEILDKFLVNMLPPKAEIPSVPTEDDINLDVIQLSAKKEEAAGSAAVKQTKPRKVVKKQVTGA